MPLVGMRRRTRVFGTRVLRSGKRSWSGPWAGKHIREAVDTGAGHGELWIDLFNNSNPGGGSCENAAHPKQIERQNDTQAIAEMDIVKPKSAEDLDREAKMWGSVYFRKRKRNSPCVGSEESFIAKKIRALESRKYGKQFVRKQWRVKSTNQFSSCPSTSNVASSARKVISPNWFASLLSVLLRYMRRSNLSLSQLSTFLLSEPLAQVFSSHGIGFHFVLDSCCIETSGMCKFYEARCPIPLFSVDFSSVPSCFTYLHSSLHIRPTFSRLTVVECLEVKDDVMSDVVEDQHCSSGGDSDTKATVSAVDSPEKERNLSQTAIGAPKFSAEFLQFRNGLNFHSIHKKKRSLRCRRTKSLSVIIHNPEETNGTLGSNLFRPKDEGIAMTSGRQQRTTSSQKGSTPTTKEMKSLLVEMIQNIDSLSCSANVLVIESHKCYRIKDAIVKLESSPSKQWFLAVKKDETIRYSLNPQKVMRPCSNNRVTHDIIWTEDINNWKLEFLNRLDWMIFKELYKECFDRNLQALNANDVFVPGAHKVTDYTDHNTLPFSRPASYISVVADEVSRALVRRTANYDLDSEDEEWLKNLNMTSSLAVNDGWNKVSEEKFELLIDCFEKASYCTPDDLSNEKAQSLFSHLERKEVVEAVYGYWTEKRNRKGVSLLRVFQPYKASRDRLLSKPGLRKKRSYKHQSSFTGRGKRLNLLQASMMLQNGVKQEVIPLAKPEESVIAQDVEEKKGMRSERVITTIPFNGFSTSLKTSEGDKMAAARRKKLAIQVEETRDAANRSEIVAIEKRQKAQDLMENADLATYRASIALRIAEAARLAQATGLPVSSFLPEGYPDVIGKK